MGNVFHRCIHCADTEIIEYSRKGEFGSDDSIKLVDRLECPRSSPQPDSIDIELLSELESSTI